MCVYLLLVTQAVPTQYNTQIQLLLLYLFDFMIVLFLGGKRDKNNDYPCTLFHLWQSKLFCAAVAVIAIAILYGLTDSLID